MDLNSSTLVGRLADDPKLYPHEDASKTRATFRLAVNRAGRTDSEGKPLVDWINVVVFGKRAPAIAEHCYKGREVTVMGEIHTNDKPHLNATGQQLQHPDTGKPLYQNWTEVLATFISFGAHTKKFLADRASGAVSGAAPAVAGSQQMVDAITQAVLAQVTAATAGASAPADAAAPQPDAADNPLEGMA